MAELDSADWAARFDEFGVPYAPVQTRDEWAASETVAANDLLLPVPGDDGERSARDCRRCCRAPRVRSSASTATASHATLRAIAGGQRRCRSTGCSSSTPPSSSPGPFGGLVLQDLGARVVKVDPPGGEDFRTVAAASFSALNRDKDQVCLDLKDAAGRDAFTALVHRADALVENMSPPGGRRAATSISTACASRNPQLVHCHIDGWGGAARRHAWLRSAPPGAERADGRAGRRRPSR